MNHEFARERTNRAMSTKDVAFQLPKTELHLHLDGSVSEAFLVSRARVRGISLPCPEDKVRDYLFDLKTQFWRNKKLDSQEGMEKKNWPHFDFVNQFLQTEEDLEEGAADICNQLISQNVWLAEIRFCPALHQHVGLSTDEVTEAVVRGFKRGSMNKLKGGIIICALRSYDSHHFQEMVELTAKWLGRGVVGFDVAGDEGSFPLHVHRKEVERACKLVPTTCHAGEWPNSVENIRLAVDIGVKRIGHGLTLRTDTALMKRVAELKIGVECCVTANLGWRPVTFEGKHPIRDMYEAGVVVSTSSDNQLMAGTKTKLANTIEDVIYMREELGFEWKDIKQILLNGVRTSFAVDIDTVWIQSFEAEINRIFKEHNILF